MNQRRPVLKVRNLTKRFRLRSKSLFQSKQYFNAVDGVSFSINENETLGLVGESGCGKTTLARCLVNILSADQGSIEFYINGKSINVLEPTRNQKRILTRNMQMVFQNPYASFNPRMRIEDIIREPLIIHKTRNYVEQLRIVRRMIDLSGLQAHCLQQYPHEFSGGQLQRIAIARALVLSPALLICDEAVSALDVSIQAQIINLLKDLQLELGLTYLFIAHDLSVVEYISSTVMVMYDGKILEIADAEVLYEDPKHPYTEALLAAVPVPDPRYKNGLVSTTEDTSSHGQSGCCFAGRCRYSKTLCFNEEPALGGVNSKDQSHFTACHFVNELTLRGFEKRRE